MLAQNTSLSSDHYDPQWISLGMQLCFSSLVVGRQLSPEQYICAQHSISQWFPSYFRLEPASILVISQMQPHYIGSLGSKMANMFDYSPRDVIWSWVQYCIKTDLKK